MPSEKFVKVGDYQIKASAWSVIRSMVQAGLSANKIQESLKGTEYAIRRQTLLTVVRDIKGEALKKDAWKYTPKKYTISDEKHEIAKFSMDRNYAYTVEITTFSEILGKNVKRYVRLKKDEKLAQSSLINEAIDVLYDAEGFDQYMETVVKAEIRTAMKRAR